MLVEIRSQHSGGDLILKYSEYEHRWSLENSDHVTLQSCLPPPLRYIAYKNSNVITTTERVSCGAKVLLQYDIYVHDEYDSENIQSHCDHNQWDLSCAKYFPSPITVNFTQKLAEHLHSMLSEEGVAIPTFHFYADAQPTPSRLYHNDLQLFSFLVHSGYCVQIMPIILAECSIGNIQKYSIQGVPTIEIGYILSEEKKNFVLEAHQIMFYPSKIRYVATGYEQVKLIEQIDHGLDEDELESRYYCVVFIISSWKKSGDSDEFELTW